MENASKALIIAGAILLAILIIGLGVFIYNQASNTVSDTGMDQIAVRQFNAQFEPYIMNNASGSTAMALYDTVQTYNATTTNNKVRLVLRSNGIIGGDVDKKDLGIKLKASKKVEKDVEEGEATPVEELGKEEYITFRKSELSTLKKYNIEVTEYDSGVIKTITISTARGSSSGNGDEAHIAR